MAMKTLECKPEQLNQATGLSNLSVEVNDSNQDFVHRWSLLYVPTAYKLVAPAPLWILAPGSTNTPELQIRISEMIRYAEEQQFVFIALKAVDDLLNVFLRGHCRVGPRYADDVAYTGAVLDRAQSDLCIDSRRVFCTGYSRGARFCSRLASELSARVAAIAPVSGLRFPEPSNASRPMPIITFHGTDDPINPYEGGADPRANHEYWDDPVEVAVSKWAAFNGCARTLSYRHSASVAIRRHTSCRENADVVFAKIDGGGHTWPGSGFQFWPGLGPVTDEINASVLMGAFFGEHPLPGATAGGVGSAPSGAAGSVAMVALGAVVGMLLALTVPRLLHRVLPAGSDGEESTEDDSDEM